MNFQEEEVNAFLEIFDEAKFKIESQPGCSYLELLQGDDKQTFFTYSHWQNEEALDNYRQSSLFREIWSKTKALFAAPAEAWSNSRIYPD